MSPNSTFFCRVVSILGITCALFCLYYIDLMYDTIPRWIHREDATPGTIGWFVTLSALAALIAIGVAAGSIGLARLRIRGAKLLTFCSLLPIPLWILVRLSWHLPHGSSIAGASGVGLGGLVPIIYSLLPLWAGLVWRFAFRSSRIPQISNLPTTTKS